MEQNSLSSGSNGPEAGALEVLLRARIEREGPLSFSEFMRAALYHPQHGYYSRPQQQIGRAGDFFTSVSVGAVYGELLAGVFRGLWQAMGAPHPWVIAEQGGHDGQLAVDVLTALRVLDAEAFAAARWRVIETRPAWRARQEETLAGAGMASHLDHGVGPAQGILFSNELADALPVDVVVWRSGQWMERRVGWDATQGFFWVEAAASPEQTAAAAARGLPRIEGYGGEIAREAEAWAATWHHHIERGFVLSVDYGDAGPGQFTPERAEGTLRAFRKHRRVDHVLQNPGQLDITANVDFSALVRAARRAGWEVAGWSDQHHFLTAAAMDTGWLTRAEARLTAHPQDPGARLALRQFQTLSHPTLMGRAFHVLLMARGVPTGTTALPGFRFSRPFPEDEPS